MHLTDGKVVNEINRKELWQEGEFIPTCKAFPDGIPESITLSDSKHDKITKAQAGEYVYEPVK